MMEPSEVSVTVSKAGVVTKVDPSNVVVIEMGREPEGVTVVKGGPAAFDGLVPGPGVGDGEPAGGV